MSTSSTNASAPKSIVAKVVGFVFLGVGSIFAIIGFWIMSSDNAFVAESVETQLLVAQMERRLDDGSYQYRPHFEARRDDGKVVQYVGNVWVSPKPHNQGDIVAGRVNWATGEIRSLGMMGFIDMLGKIFAAIGSVLFSIGAVLLVFHIVRSRRVEVIWDR